MTAKYHKARRGLILVWVTGRGVGFGRPDFATHTLRRVLNLVGREGRVPKSVIRTWVDLAPYVLLSWPVAPT
jgi:hypothetical protein